MTKSCVLALDLGTTSSRAMVFDRSGRAIGTGQQEFPQLFPSPGHVEHALEAGLGSLGQLPNLEILFLDMKGQPITDKELPRLLALTRLKEFYLFTSNIDEPHYLPLLTLPNLVTLSIDGGQLRDRVIVELEKHSQITRVGVNHCALTSDGIRSLAKLRHLIFPQLMGSPCSDADLEHLAALTNLRNLSIRQTKVTAAGVAALQKALPNCKIDWDSPGHG